MNWHYDKDIVVVCYDPTVATEVELGHVIKELGYTIEIVDLKSVENATAKQADWQTPLPDNAPPFFREAFEAARQQGRPIIIDFWASWCGPCQQLKKITFADEKVKPLLEQCQLIYVDLDDNPQLGELYGVKAVPDVFLINRDGRVVDRFQNFEPPDIFRRRLLALIDLGSNGVGASQPNEPKATTDDP